MTPLEEIAHIANVQIELEVQLDQRWMKLSEILSMQVGTIIVMNRSAGENIDVFVGGRLTATGEIVIIESIMGVRITDFNTEQ